MSRTLAAPTPTNISTKSEPLILKNGTSASPEQALARKGLSLPRGTQKKAPLSYLGPKPGKPVWIPQIVNDLLEFPPWIRH
jgi:hypothetical protein